MERSSNILFSLQVSLNSRKMCSNGENGKIFIQVTDLQPTVVMQEIIKNGQEDGFFLCDVSDIIDKHNKWKCAIPRVKPFYGKFVCNIWIDSHIMGRPV